MAGTAYEKGATEIGPDLFAYLQPRGGWGLSNAGLVAAGEQSLLVDTLFDERHTRDMLVGMRRMTRAAERIELVVNTHANGDHCFGNGLVRGARIMASEAAAAEMAATPPSRLARLARAARLVRRLGPLGARLGGLLGAAGFARASAFLEGAPYFGRVFAEFDFEGLELVPPSETFRGRLDLEVGDRRVSLLELGPAHTGGDVVVHVPDARAVFTGDLVFVGVHPVAWSSVAGWLAACDRILELDVDVVVPGHGPVTDLGGVRRMADYLRAIRDQARGRYDAGLSAEQAAREIALEGFEGWGDAERVVANVQALYREFSGDRGEPDVIAAFAAMARLANDLQNRTTAPPQV